MGDEHPAFMSAASYEAELEWVAAHAPRAAAGVAKLPDLSGCRIACSMHLEIKLVGFVRALLAKGAKVFLITCNTNTVQNDFVRILTGEGAEAYAWRDMDEAAYQEAIQKAIAWRPTHLCEMGADITHALHRGGRPGPGAHDVVASLEATGSGIDKLHGLDLSYPVFNWDDVVAKECLHNRYMVGLSTWLMFVNRTFLSLHEKTVLVVGYGPVGQGLADSAKAFGGQVVVVEKDPGRLTMARFGGWRASPALTDALLAEADVVVTATGARSVVSSAHFGKLKSGCFLLNVGHHDHEIDVPALYKAAGKTREVRPHVTEVSRADGGTLYVLAHGSMANLVAGKGDTVNAFDTMVATMLGGIGYITGGAGAHAEAQAHLLPQEAWEEFF